jgi:iron complex outermembrane receptor protein
MAGAGAELVCTDRLPLSTTPNLLPFRGSAMKLHTTPVARAVSALLFGAAALGAAPAGAQTAPAPAAKPAAAPAEAQRIVVTGIRASLESALRQKRGLDSVAEVITAEDIGKMPDKNIADSLQRVPGVAISSASASEGGFDENDRVSLRGTNPSLTQTLINGHGIGSGDWFVLNQTGTVGRSVSYSLLPSELVKQVVVRKSAQADLVEGGVAGAVDIQTRKPLEFRQALTLEASVGAVYADLPRKTDPQLSALINWKGETVGVMAQVFSQKRSLRRDGIETLGYSRISATSPIAQTNPDLAGVAYPNAVGSALFEQTRERTGGLITVQVQPTKELGFDLTAFTSEMKARNYNRNYLVWGSRILGGGGNQAPQAPDAGYVVKDGTLVQASFTPIPGNQYVIVDNILRPDARSETGFVNLDGQFKTGNLTVSGKLGSSRGKGETPSQAVFEGDVFNTGASWTLNGVDRAPDSGVRAGNPAVFTGTRLDWVFGASPARTKDNEDWAQLDGEWRFTEGLFSSVKTGLRSTQHERDSQFVAQGPKWSADPFNVANLPAWNGQTYPSDFGKGLSGNFLRNVWQLDPGVLEAWGNKFSNRDPLERQYFPGEFAMEEKNLAAYVMGNFLGENWSGNVGVRFVQSKVGVLTNVAIPGSVCAVQAPCAVPGAITTSAFGSFYRKLVENTHTDVLPSLNLKWDLSPNLVGRFALAKTLARPDFSALGGSVSLDDTNRTGSGGNPNLEPIRSTNIDASLEWYFAPRSVLSAGLFVMDLKNYVGFGVSEAVYFNEQSRRFDTYRISSPVNSKGRVKGLEFGWQQSFGAGFGANLNYTYADGEEQGGRPLVGNSKHTWNAGAWFENDTFNARVAYNFRSKFFNGLDRASAQNQADTATLSASLGWKISERFTLSLDGMNLNNPVLKYYADNTSQPTAVYNNGRQYYLTLRVKL